MMRNTCPICLKTARVAFFVTSLDVSCEVCGKYFCSKPMAMAAASGNLISDEKRYILSGAIRNRSEWGENVEILKKKDVETILDSVSIPSDPFEAIDLLLKYLRRKASKADEYVPLNIALDYPIVYAKDADEFDYYLQKAMERKYVKRREQSYQIDLAGWDRIAELDKRAEQEPGIETTPKAAIESGEAERVLDDIKKEIDASSIEKALKEVALYDLKQARLAYKSRAFKACVVMLGAVLEGLMLGTIRRADVLSKIGTDPNPPKVVKRLGLNSPELADKIADELGFEDLKNTIHQLIPEIEKLKVESIQTFRNAVHPWKTVRDPAIYADPDQTRAMNHLTSLALLARHILSWIP